jgi:hypothetical protein
MQAHLVQQRCTEHMHPILTSKSCRLFDARRSHRELHLTHATACTACKASPGRAHLRCAFCKAAVLLSAGPQHICEHRACKRCACSAKHVSRARLCKCASVHRIAESAGLLFTAALLRKSSQSYFEIKVHLAADALQCVPIATSKQANTM